MPSKLSLFSAELKRRKLTRVATGLLTLTVLPLQVEAQTAPSGPEDQTGWEVTGLPALNYDSDEGFGYGLVLSLYNYGDGGYSPYRFTLQPLVFLTTEGRRDVTLFFDAPHLLSGGWRIDGFLGFEKQIATPYYGLGNNSLFLEENTEGDNPYFYRFGRERMVLRGNLQRPFGGLPLRLLMGAQIEDISIDPTPKDEGNTLLAEELGPDGPVPGGIQASVRGGLIWDSRDRESGTRKGVWTSVLVETVMEALGSDHSFTRWTLADRRYFSIRGNVIFANRVVLQHISGSPPFYALSYVQSSFGGQEALGGSQSIRGILRNRYIGEGVFFWNAEIRWRFREIRVRGKDGHLAAIGFLDWGRVWEDGVEIS
ncbi:MAG: BamA/TamA family outer membrane protein, partial [Longimicrobiales bacterium]|nr:BamA/TamA family outer membrane protein [Longimicrobiales bacterium]